jgi:peptidyl-prolyl cis-trans isomerase C
VRRVFPLMLVAALLATAATACRKAEEAAEPAAAEAPAPPVAAEEQPPEPPKPMPAELPDVLARVNGEDVTRADLDRLIKNMELGAGQPVPADRRDEIYRGALDQLITYTVLKQEVRARKISIPDGEIEVSLQEMQKQFPTDKEFKQALSERGMTLDRLRADARIDMAINKMIEDEVALEPEATDVQVREFYDKNPEKFTQDEAVRASHILIRVDPKASEAEKAKARARAEDLAKQAKGGADFGDLARKHSDDGSAPMGGDLNFLVPGQTVAAFDRTVFSMKPGEISDVVETEFGFHVIKVTEKRDASVVPFPQISPRIRAFLTDEAKQERAQAFIEELKKKATIEVLV